MVHNAKLDDWVCWQSLAHQLLKVAGERPLVAVDWTEWHSGLRVLTTAVCVARRAIPICKKTCEKIARVHSQNTVENAFLQKIRTLSPLIAAALLIFDRGLRRVSFILGLHLLDRLFIVRLAAKVHASGEEYSGLLREHPLRPGQRVDLGVCALREDGRAKARILGPWDNGQKEPWWLATNLEDPAGSVAEYYDRRMAVEEAFRDGKG